MSSSNEGGTVGGTVDQAVRVQCYHAFLDTYGDDGKRILATSRRLHIVQAGQTNAERKSEFKKAVAKLQALVSLRLFSCVCTLMMLCPDDFMRNY